MNKREITLNVNGSDHTIRVESRRTLLDALRDDCGLSGTHSGCEHGVCGACTVIVNDEPVRSCLMFAAQAVTSKIRTVEGLSAGVGLNPLQQAFTDHHALQCGFCTPGFLMLATSVLEHDPYISDEALLDALSSNLCRCTGYDTILSAIQSARDKAKAGLT
jgi:carbon-monoxide dehydrogenase small subunit